MDKIEIAKNLTLAEQLMYSTVLIETDSGRGTGFFFQFSYDTGNVPIIITNKHVINYKNYEKVKFKLHVLKNDGNITENIVFEDTVYWNFHYNKDLCFCYAAPIIQKIERESHVNLFFINIPEEVIYDDEKLKQLDAIEEVIMVGYPIGISDIKNNYPVFRRGITASHPASSFNEEGISIVDMACFPGSSGSPIFMLNQGNYKDKSGNLYIGSSRFVFLGILYAGPIFNAQGNLEIIEIPTKHISNINVPIMVNLGYYVKAQEVYEFKKQIYELIKNTNPTNTNQNI